MKIRVLFGICSVLAAAAWACDDSQSVEEHHQDGIANYSITVKIDSVESGKIDLADMMEHQIKITSEGQEYNVIPISDIIAQANHVSPENLERYLAQFLCEYEAKDGFKPSSLGDRCKVVSCSETLKSYLNTSTHSMIYDDHTDMAKQGCYNVKDVVSVVMYASADKPVEEGGNSGEGGENPGGDGGSLAENNFDIIIDGDLYESIDISTLIHDGSVAVADILNNAGVQVDLTTSLCEVQAIDHEDDSNSYYPSNKSKCKDWLSCKIVADGAIVVGENNIMTYVETQSGCYGTTGSNTIAIKTNN